MAGRGWGRWLLLLAFLVVVIGVGAAIGIANAPDQWYAALAKPPFNPPNWLFAPAWFAIYALIAIAGWRCFSARRSSPEMVIWCAQMLLNWVWSPIWFGAHAVWPAFAIILGLLVLIVAFIVASWRPDRLSALLFIPYLLWVAFASLLNLSIAVLN